MATKHDRGGPVVLDRDRLPAPARRPGPERVLLVLEVLLAAGAVGGAVGVAFGDILGDASELLPFGSVVFAGAAFAVINGLWPLAVAISGLTRQEWAYWGHLSVGAALMGWILVQVSYLGPPIHWLQILYFVWGLVIAGLASRILQQRRRSSGLSPATSTKG